MDPAKVVRSRVCKLTDLPNIGPASAADLLLLGIKAPEDLQGRCPYELYNSLCRITNHRHDPCVIDVFLSITHFMAGEPAQSWWHFTQERKTHLRNLALAEG